MYTNRRFTTITSTTINTSTFICALVYLSVCMFVGYLLIYILTFTFTCLCSSSIS